MLLNNSYKSYSNGTLKNQTAFSAAVTATNPDFSHTLGGYKYFIDTSSQYAAIDICEIIVYNSALSNTDRAVVESYLMSKWGIT